MVRLTSVAVVLVATLATPLAAQIRGETIVRGLQSPVAAIADPTEPSTFLIVEQRGLILVAQAGQLLAEPFLDLRDQISVGGERGLLGLALAPDYVDSRRLFVNFTNRDGNTVIARFVRREDDPRRADRDSRFDLRWPSGRRVLEQPFSNHNGGHLLFGPDGYLYVGLGDGGSGGDPMNHAQRPESLLGKMLRIDVDVPADDDRGYRVPEDNPFLDGDPATAAAEIWAFGLRNPWRYSFDDPTRGGTGALLIADVGQNAREEINFEPAGRGGRNYGWRLREGRQPFDERTNPAFRPLIEPIHDYGRSLGASVTGGFVYRGADLDLTFDGRYFYADFISGRVFSIGLHLDDAGEARADDEREHTAQLGGRDTIGMVSSFATDHRGELLLLNYGGSLVRLVPDFSVVPQRVVLSGDAGSGPIDLQWTTPASGSVAAVDYLVERLQAGRVVERVSTERPQITFPAAAGDCFRVRARARSGVTGPAADPVCIPQPAGDQAPPLLF
jgi:glucose/arabinose dehydrogenase